MRTRLQKACDHFPVSNLRGLPVQRWLHALFGKLLRPFQHAADAIIAMAKTVDNNDFCPSGFRCVNRLNKALWAKRGAHIIVHKIKLPSIVQSASGFRVDEGDLAGRGHAFRKP